ncbi:MAG TPA: hypothetical protein VNG11_01000 [Chloroflexota bacterium]|nr:hypothetical protein [Chloroflexota bacterium]
MARPLTHLVVSTGLATLEWIRTGRLAPTIAPLISGFLIDADHLVDFTRYQASGKKSEGRIVLPLHGWEYAILLLLARRLFGKGVVEGLLLGYVGHLVVDQFTNTTTHPLTYFVSFRWWRGFPSDLFTHPSEAHIDWMNGSLLELLKHF